MNRLQGWTFLAALVAMLTVVAGASEPSQTIVADFVVSDVSAMGIQTPPLRSGELGELARVSEETEVAEEVVESPPSQSSKRPHRVSAGWMPASRRFVASRGHDPVHVAFQPTSRRVAPCGARGARRRRRWG